MIRVILVDDHDIFAKGLKLLLEEEQHIRVECVMNDAASLLKAIKTVPYDLLLLDVQLPDMDAEELLKQIRFINPDAKIIYLTMMRGTRYIHRLTKLDIQGYLLKNAPAQELIEAITAVYNGKTYFSKEISIADDGEEVKKTIIIGENKVEQILSKREIEVIKLICQEYSNKEIAEKLFVSINTVDTHRKNIYLKLGVNNVAGVVRFSLQHGLIK
jgi:two-component system response regulator NreC